MLFDKTKKKYVQNIKNLTKKFYNRLFQHALVNIFRPHFADLKKIVDFGIFQHALVSVGKVKNCVTHDRTINGDHGRLPPQLKSIYRASKEKVR